MHIAMPHIDDEHIGVPFAIMQMLPHVPQLTAFIDTSTSQPFVTRPSQFRNVPEHIVIVHVPAMHDAVAFGGLQCAMQAPQLFISTAV
jgi:hypothetical protein